MSRIPSGRGAVALHELRDGGGPTLLALHALGGRAQDFAPLAEHWPGRVLALDFAGHGASDWTRGGSYTPELFAADADVVLAAAGEARLVGTGLGAWVGLLVAGARPERVPAALLLPGRGLAGCGPAPDRETPHAERSAQVLAMLEARSTGPRPAFDPLATACERDPRPPEYARAFADAAQCVLLAELAGARPPWWEAARAARRVELVPAEPAEALVRLLAS